LTPTLFTFIGALILCPTPCLRMSCVVHNVAAHGFTLSMPRDSMLWRTLIHPLDSAPLLLVTSPQLTLFSLHIHTILLTLLLLFITSAHLCRLKHVPDHRSACSSQHPSYLTLYLAFTHVLTACVHGCSSLILYLISPPHSSKPARPRSALAGVRDFVTAP